MDAVPDGGGRLVPAPPWVGRGPAPEGRDVVHANRDQALGPALQIVHGHRLIARDSVRLRERQAPIAELDAPVRVGLHVAPQPDEVLAPVDVAVGQVAPALGGAAYEVVEEGDRVARGG